MDNCVKELGKEIKCRDSLIRHLYLLLTDEPLFQSIFVYGHVSCGKSFILQHMLKYLNYKVSIINCIEHVSDKSLFEKIILDLSGAVLSWKNDYKLENKCDNFVEFISQLKAIANKMHGPVVILLENGHKLRDMHENILPAMLRLQELANINICVIISSDVPFEKYRGKIGIYEPIKIYFPQYNERELLELLMQLTQPDNCNNKFYKKYLELFLSVFFRFCRDLTELRYMAKKNFVKYVEPLESQSISANVDLTAILWRNICPIFKANLEVIYLRMSTDDFEHQSTFSREIESTQKLALSFELPGFAKYLLIAAFLASYNPPKEDRRLFMREGGARKKRAYKRRQPRAVAKSSAGPHSFPLNRLLAIFCSIYDRKVDLNAILLTQIPSMCHLGLLSLVGDSNINEPKYKCCVNYDFVLVISKNIGVEVNKYLYDRAQ